MARMSAVVFALLLALILQTPVSAKVSSCTLLVERGTVRFDYFPLAVRNVGNAVAVGIEVTEQIPASAFTTMTFRLAFLPHLMPGGWESWMMPKSAWQHSWSARSSGCVPVGKFPTFYLFRDDHTWMLSAAIPKDGECPT